MLTDVDAVLFDLDGTLLDRRRSFERFIREQWARFSSVQGTVDQDAYVRALVALDADGYAPRKGLFTGMVARFALPSHLADTLLRDYRAGFPAACLLFPDALETLATIRASGRPIGLITNGSVRMQSGKIECLALASVFDVILISDGEGIAKPDPEIFRRALTRIGAGAKRAVFVGDNPEADIAGARAAGMRTIWRRDAAVSQAVEADAAIDQLAELVAILGLEAR